MTLIQAAQIIMESGTLPIKNPQLFAYATTVLRPYVNIDTTYRMVAKKILGNNSGQILVSVLP